MAIDLDDIAALLGHEGRRQYGGEPVSQLEHALQAASLAEEAGESAPTIVAALLHDLGHLLAAPARSPAAGAPECDDLHQYQALPFLRPLFPDAVLDPIRLHVDAKRYLCAVDPAYAATLSPASVRSLALQGGALTENGATRFIAMPHAEAAVRLRRYDDRAKVPGRATPPLTHYLRLAGALLPSAA